MAGDARLRLDEVERQVCDIASVQLGVRRDRISANDRLIEDLGCESLDSVELLMEIEEAFEIALPEGYEGYENPDAQVFLRKIWRGVPKSVDLGHSTWPIQVSDRK